MGTVRRSESVTTRTRSLKAAFGGFGRMSGPQIDVVRSTQAEREASFEAKIKEINERNKKPSSDFTEFDWVKLNQVLSTDPTTGQKYIETSMEKTSRTFGQNPFIWIGGLATTGFLGAGLYAVISRNSRMQQNMMRGRVVAQGLTFGAIGMGVGLALKQNFEKKRAVTTRIPAESPNET